MDQQEHTEISAYGEFGLIRHLTKNNDTRRAGTLLGVGDDAAVIDHFGKQTVITTDVLLEGIHFDFAYTPLRYLGYKAVAVNLSDLCAMGATPTHITVSIALSSRFTVELLEELYEGIYEACDKYDVDLIGGDTSSSRRGFFISVTAIGEIAPDQFVTRTGASPNDLICVSGNLGAAYLGLQLLEREKKIMQEHTGLTPDFEDKKYIIQRLLKPEPRTDIVEFLAANGIRPTSMIDVSDGLSSELFHLCTGSDTGCVIFEDKIPIHPQTRETSFSFNLVPSACALSGGEDYELLFTIRQQDYEKLADTGDIAVIGYMTEAAQGLNLQTPEGKQHPLQAQGWQAFGE